MNARRIIRWLRLLVACLAFTAATPRPALVVDPLDQIVLVAAEDGRDAREEARAEAPRADVPAIATEDAVAPSFDSPRLVSRRWLTNCAFLL